MRYPDWGLTDVDLFAPKLLGIFERELYEAVERLIALAPRTIVNIGAADGWFAVGLARRLPDCQVAAFDINEERMRQLRQIADLNGVADRVRVEARECLHRDLQELLDDRAAVVCDCDGCEGSLLDPELAPSLRQVPLIVESHDLLVEGTTERLMAAFQATHEIESVSTEPRFIDDFPQLDFMPWVTRQLAIAEFRGAPMKWLVMHPR
jgi:hypothetical protein